MLEDWRDIPDAQGYYEVSTLGRVRSKDRVVDYRSRWGTYTKRRVAGRLLKPWSDGNGYLVVYICADGERREAINVHRLVASAFLPGDAERLHVNHKNGVKTDNRPENLEWCTRSENMIHAQDTGLSDKRKTIEAVSKDGAQILTFESVAAAARHFGTDAAAICNAMRRGHSARGFHWRYPRAA